MDLALRRKVCVDAVSSALPNQQTMFLKMFLKYIFKNIKNNGFN